MRYVRTNLQICEAIAHHLTASDARPQLIAECVASQNMREDILRDRLKVHGVPTDIAEAFVAEYVAAKAAPRS